MRLNVNTQLNFLQTVNDTYWVNLLKEFLINVSEREQVNKDIILINILYTRANV